MHCKNCAKRVRDVVLNLNGVRQCDVNLDTQKVIVIGDFNFEEVLDIVRRKLRKRAEVLTMTKKSDVISKEDGESEIVPAKNEESDIVKETDDKPEESISEVEYHITCMSEEHEIYFGKILSTFKGIEKCVVDMEKKRIVVTGDFDQEKLLKKLQKRMRKIMKKDVDIEKYHDC
ncbi:unnamed protein product [Eruca vesicaria subsp. sativa]|uniref:HMA domain-containing protein n=1 Tax=Eruca vesicaria subsp. sativa TaxID=29727 RepID=A0ABC8J7K7_ERUVS|nr:unnamed protein product [Eruca vesicaria subsp. sativa]